MATVAVASHSPARRGSSASRVGAARSLSRSRQILASSPGFQARTLSPSRPPADSLPSIDSSVASLAPSSSDESPRGRSSGSSASSASTPPTTDDERVGVTKTAHVHYNRGTAIQSLPLPFYPASLRNAQDQGRQVLQGLPAVPTEPQVTTIDEQDV